MAEPTPSRRPGRLRRWVVRPLFWALALLAVLGWLGSRLLDSDFLRQRERTLVVARLSEALGRPVEVGSVELRLVPLAAEVVDLRIPGPRPGDPPLAVVPRLRIEGELPGPRGGVVRLHEVTVERPQIFIDVRPDGSTNLPLFSSAGGAGGGHFEVRLDALRVIDGELRLAEQQVALDFSARAVRAHLVAARGSELGGDVTAQEVELRLPKAKPYPFSVSGRVRLSAKGIQIDAARVVGPEIAATAHGSVGWSPQPSGKIEVVGQVSSDAFVRLGYLRDEVKANPHFEGAVTWSGATWAAEGRFATAEAVFVGRRVEALEGRISAGASAIRVVAERARAYGGAASGTFEVALREPGPPASLKLHVADSELAPLLAEEHVPIGFVAGRTSGDFEYRFRFDDAAHGSGRLDANLTAAEPVGRQVALAGPAALEIDKGTLRLTGVHLRSPTEAVEVEGALELEPVSGAFTVHAESTDLGELAVVLPPDVASPAPLWFPTRGAGTVDVSLALERGALTTRIRFDATDVEAPGARAARARGELTLLPASVEGMTLELERPGGDLRLGGRIPLGEPGGSASASPGGVALAIAATSWPLAEARPWLPRAVADLPLDGSFSGTVNLSGRLLDPTGEVAGTLAPASWAGASLGTLRSRLHFDPAGLMVDQATLETGSGRVEGHGRLRYADRGLDVALAGDGLALDRAPLADLAGGHLKGALALAATIGGTLDRPRVQARLVTRNVVLADQPPLPEATLTVDWDGERLQAKGSLLGLVEVDGAGPLTTAHAALELEVRSAALRRLVELAVGVPQPDLDGHLVGKLTLSGEPGKAGSLAAELRLSEVEASYGAHHFALREPALVRLAGGRVRIDSLYLAEAGSASELFLAGGLGLGAAAPLDLKIQAAIDSNWVDLLGPALRAEGQLQVLGSVRGTLAQPQLNGEAVVEGARVILLGFPHALEGLDATLFFYPNQVVLDGLTARLGGGTVTASGSLPLGGEESGVYRFQAALRDVTLRYPEGWLLRGSGELVLVPTADGRQVRGAVTLDRAYYLQDIKMGVAQLIQKILQKQRIEVTDTSPIFSDTQLAVGIRAPGTVRVRNNVANLRGTADLALRGTLAVPVVFGRVDLDAGGRVTYGDNDYTVDRAVVQFTNPYRFEPALDVVARTKVNDYRVTVNLNGKLDRLNVNFASDPPVSDLDVFSLLATGQPTTTATTPGLTASQPGTPNQSYGAMGFLYGQAASLIGQRVTGLFGIDRFRVDPLTTTGDSIASVRLTVGKRLRRDLYVTYTVDPASTKEQYVKVEWQMRPELALVLTQNSDGTYAVDARWEKRF